MSRPPAHVTALIARLRLADPEVLPLDTGWGERGGLYLVTDGSRRLVLKASDARPSRIVLRPRELTERVSMRLEIETYRALELGQWRHFHHPRLLSTDGRSYLLLEYVLAADWPPDFTRSILLALLEFQRALPNLMGWRIGRLLQGLRLRSPWRLLPLSTWVSLREGRWRIAARTWRVYLSARLAITTSGSPRLAQHGDMTYGNVVADDQGRVWFIDFQRVLPRQSLAFRDVVQLAIDPSSPDGFDTKTLQGYARLWRTELKRSARDAAHQLRAALLLQVLYVLHGYAAGTPRFRAPYRRFLEGTLLSDEAYAAWLRDIVEDGLLQPD